MKPTYEELVEQLRWCVGTIENAAEILEEDDIDEETPEVRERLVEINKMLERASS